MEGAYAYFQHPLRLEPELDFWLWDNGAAIKEADAKLRKNKDGALVMSKAEFQFKLVTE